MTKSTIHIPPAALVAGARAIQDMRYATHLYGAYDIARAAFEAMVEAWPGMFETPATFCMTLDDYRDCLLLPLTEKQDDKA